MKSKFLVFFIATTLFLFYGCDEFTTSSDGETTEVVEGKPHDVTLLLTVDGGGVKGVVPATILAQLEKDLGKPIYQIFDVIGGTSTGGIISVGLTTPRAGSGSNVPMKADSLVNIYLKQCNNMLVPVPNAFSQIRPQYFAHRKKYMSNPAAGVEVFLKELLGDSFSMKDALDNMASLPYSKVKEVFTTSYIVNGAGGSSQPDAKMGVNYGPYEFTWSNAIHPSKNENYYAWEAARGTSAAPTFFPIAHLGGNNDGRSNSEERWVIDGGVVTNNPIITGLDIIRKKQNGNIKNVVAVSLGCGINPFNGGVGITNEEPSQSNLSQKYGFWGAYTWAVSDLQNLNGDKGKAKILNLLMFANQFTADNRFETLITTNSIEAGQRFQPILPQNINNSFDCNMVSALHQATLDYITYNAKGKAEYEALKNMIQKYLPAK